MLETDRALGSQVLKAMAETDWGMSEHQLAAIKANLDRLGKNLIN